MIVLENIIRDGNAITMDYKQCSSNVPGKVVYYVDTDETKVLKYSDDDEPYQMLYGLSHIRRFCKKFSESEKMFRDEATLIWY